MKRSSIYVGVTVAFQILGVVIGLMVIRLTTPTEYGIYSLAFGMFAAGSNLSDAGIGSTIISQTASRPTENRRLRLWIEIASRFRRRVGRIVQIGCSAVMLFLGIQQGIEWHIHAMSILAIVLLLEAAFIRGIWENYYRVTGTAHESQVINFVWTVLRFICVGSLFFVPGSKLIWLLVILLVTNWGPALHIRGRAVRRIGQRNMRSTGTRELKIIRRAFRHQLPVNSINIARIQLLSIVITMFAGLQILGQVNALGRLAMAYVVVIGLLEEIIAPRLARLSLSKFLKSLAVVGVVMLLIIALGTLLVYLLADPILFVAGPAYKGLVWELVVTMIGAGLMAAAGCWGFINQARYWVEGAWVVIPLTVLWFVASLSLLDIKTLPGAVLLMASQAIPLLLTEFYRTVLGWRRSQKSQNLAGVENI